jgi:putative PIN family toxin of toxin-antitoxin system
LDSDPIYLRFEANNLEKPLVLDTNIILDLFVFNDPDLAALKPALLAGLENKQLNWIATQDMRIELERVLTYPKIMPRMAFYQIAAADVLAKFDRLTTLVEPAPKAKWICKDPDDQRFIDLAVQHKATLLSKDQAVLCMAKRLLTAEAVVQKATDFTLQIGIQSAYLLPE